VVVVVERLGRLDDGRLDEGRLVAEADVDDPVLSGVGDESGSSPEQAPAMSTNRLTPTTRRGQR
jgi:hypothetical protein